MKTEFKIPKFLGHAQEPDFSRPWLAPLAGYSDLPFRLLCREQGASVCETEMISAKGIYYKSANTAGLLQNTGVDSPLVVQLFGGEPDIMAYAVRTLRLVGYTMFDCNLGCSVRKMLRQNAGASLLGEPDKVVEIARAMLGAAKEVLEDIPQAVVGFKIRLGLDSSRPVLPDLAMRLEEAGASWIALHPRYARQGFTGRADWNELAKLASKIDIPLIASGDLLSADQGVKCLAQTGVKTVMYARGALMDPAIFKKHADLLKSGYYNPASPQELKTMINRHVELARLYCSEKNVLFKMRSIIPRYVRARPYANELRKALCACNSCAEIPDVLNRFLDMDQFGS